MGKISFEGIRQWIYLFAEMGFPIGLVTFDGFQSEDMTQILTARGFNVEYLSVDKSLEPYTDLKESIYEQRADYYYDATFMREVKEVEEVKGLKIDHPPNGSKDVSDAVAGVVHNVIRMRDWEPPEGHTAVLTF